MILLTKEDGIAHIMLQMEQYLAKVVLRSLTPKPPILVPPGRND